jgi:hypothetical protein
MMENWTLASKKRPLESASMEDEGKTALSPARNVKSICTREMRAGLLARRREGENGISSSCVQ